MNKDFIKLQGELDQNIAAFHDRMGSLSVDEMDEIFDFAMKDAPFPEHLKSEVKFLTGIAIQYLSILLND